ncbi:MAG: cysteine--tRNA ligase [Candidatus Paceibacterota bacterium]|jgi:cysteinyl-tRNA synthetase
MSLKLYNTLTKKEEEFKPIKEGAVRMYVCGPTVNDVPHLGHARQKITFDILRKYLRFLGYDVMFASNITDIDDKIIDKARELHETTKDLTEKNTKAHIEDYEKIGVEKPDVEPKATEYIKQMINLVTLLIEKEYAYTIKDDGIYFDISKYKEYGKLSHQKIENLKSGARVLENREKKNKEDFVLWKFSKPNEPEWDTPFGKGRPGWHIECSAMSESILGIPFDIHGGGQDLIFPHHEDEIAQSESAWGAKMANFWIHNGMVNVDGIKMSKSLGNFKTIRDILLSYSGEIIRYFVTSAHYRKPTDFSKNSLDDAQNSYNRLKNISKDLKNDGKINEKYLDKFKEAMNSDLNTPKALASLWELLRDENAEGKYKTIEIIDQIFGFKLLEKETLEIPEDILKLVEAREIVRKEKNWEEADRFRQISATAGYNIEDTPSGPRITKI